MPSQGTTQSVTSPLLRGGSHGLTRRGSSGSIPSPEPAGPHPLAPAFRLLAGDLERLEGAGLRSLDRGAQCILGNRVHHLAVQLIDLAADLQSHRYLYPLRPFRSEIEILTTRLTSLTGRMMELSRWLLASGRSSPPALDPIVEGLRGLLLEERSQALDRMLAQAASGGEVTGTQAINDVQVWHVAKIARLHIGPIHDDLTGLDGLLFRASERMPMDPHVRPLTMAHGLLASPSSEPVGATPPGRPHMQIPTP